MDYEILMDILNEYTGPLVIYGERDQQHIVNSYCWDHDTRSFTTKDGVHIPLDTIDAIYQPLFYEGCSIFDHLSEHLGVRNKDGQILTNLVFGEDSHTGKPGEPYRNIRAIIESLIREKKLLDQEMDFSVTAIVVSRLYSTKDQLCTRVTCEYIDGTEMTIPMIIPYEALLVQ